MSRRLTGVTAPLRTSHAAEATSVIVVDQDDVARTGYTTILAGGSPLVVAAGLTHDEALARDDWSGVDVLVIDPVDPRRRLDQVPGAAVIEHVRSCAGTAAPRIVAISSHHPDDAVRRRLREAGVDAYFQRSQVREATRLRRAVFAPEPDDALPEPVDPGVLQHLGVTTDSRVNRGVAAAFAEHLVPEAGWVGPRSRDRLARRARFNQEARLAPAGDDAVPSLAQIQRFVAWATRIEGWAGP